MASKKSGRQLKRVTFNLTEKIIDDEPKEGAGKRSGFWERASATIWGRDQVRGMQAALWSNPRQRAAIQLFFAKK